MNYKNRIELIKKYTEAVLDPNYRERKNFRRLPIMFCGPAGSGKTESLKIAGTEINLPVMNIRFSQEMPEDLSFPETETRPGGIKVTKKILAEILPQYKKSEDGEFVYRNENIDGEIVTTDQIAIDFESISGYIENFDVLNEHYQSLGLTIDDAPGGIFFLDEITRIDDRQTFQMIFQLLESGKFKGYQLPDNIVTFGAYNPSKGYITSNWFDDPAFQNRCIHIKAPLEEETWFAYAEKPDSGYTEFDIELVRMHPEIMFDEESNDIELPRLHRSLRNINYSSNLLSHIEWDNEELETELVQSIFGDTFVGPYFNVKNKMAERAISPDEILREYDKYDLGEKPFNLNVIKDEISGEYTEYEPVTLFDNIKGQKPVSRIRKLFLDQIEKGRQDYVTKVVDMLQKHILDNIEDDDFQKVMDENRLRLLRFVLDLPMGTYPVFKQGLLEGDKGYLIARLLAVPFDYENDISGRAYSEIVKHLENINRNIANED